MQFAFATATRIVFGEGTSREAPAAAREMGRRILMVTGANPRHRLGMDAVPFALAGEPSIERIREGAALARESGCDVVVAIGGGSAIDAGKAIAAMVTNPGDPLDYLEVIGRGQRLERAAAPFIAIPTTAGTGSEVTMNAVLASAGQRVKASLRSPLMLPRLAIVDPELTLGLPRAPTASTGLDALTQLIEPYVSVRANAMTDLYCVEGIRRAAGALPRVWDNPADREARRDMAWVSLLGGLSLANAGLGAVHGFAAPLGGMFPAPHGAACAAVLPHAMQVNVRALRERAPQSQALARYGEIGRLLTGRPQATAEDGVAWTLEICRKLEIPPLRAWGVGEADIPMLVEKAAKASSMKGNPLPLTPAELTEIIRQAV
jgi:alcohol dehydrogenase class IV